MIRRMLSRNFMPQWNSVTFNHIRNREKETCFVLWLFWERLVNYHSKLFNSKTKFKNIWWSSGVRIYQLGVQYSSKQIKTDGKSNRPINLIVMNRRRANGVSNSSKLFFGPQRNSRTVNSIFSLSYEYLYILFLFKFRKSANYLGLRICIVITSKVCKDFPRESANTLKNSNNWGTEALVEH